MDVHAGCCRARRRPPVDADRDPAVAGGRDGAAGNGLGSIFEQPDEASARAQLRRVIDGIRPRFPAVAELLISAEPDLLVHFTFPDTHRRQIRSANPLE